MKLKLVKAKKKKDNTLTPIIGKSQRKTLLASMGIIIKTIHLSGLNSY